MKAMQLARIGAMQPGVDPLEPVVRTVPEPESGEIRIRLLACGVCHTELDEIEGRTPPLSLPVIPGHQAIGTVDALGLTGFGSSAHIVLQLARHRFPDSPTAVFARDAEQRELALTLGADWAGSTDERSHFPLDAIIDTTPAWLPVVEAMANLRAGGRLVINAIRKEDGDKKALLGIDYATHLWREKQLVTVANVTAADISEFLALAAEVPIRPEVETYPFAEANRALLDLRFGKIRGAKVLVF